MPGRLEFQFNTRPATSAAPQSSGQGPMRLLLLGDFSHHATADRPPLGNRPTHRIDVDKLDQVLKRLAPQVGVLDETLTFQTIDDFHPDQLYQRVKGFHSIRTARQQHPDGTGEDTLGRLLGAGPGASATPPRTGSSTRKTGLDALLDHIVSPHVVPDTSAQVRTHQAAVDSAATEAMRKVLHAPSFQALESAWRGVQRVVQQLDLDDGSLELHLLDVSRTELLQDIVAAQGQVAQTALRQTLDAQLAKQAGGGGWSALVMLERFGPQDLDIGLLAALGTLAAHCGAPLLADANEVLQGHPPTAPQPPAWLALRRSEVAPWIGLVAPRVLLRLPYGVSQDSIESFAFEELLPGPPAHEQLLWGHASLAVAGLLGQSFMAQGWDMQAGDVRDLTDLPAYTFEHEGEKELQACAERYLGDTEAAALLERGLMPLLSHRHRNVALLGRLQSIAEPGAALAGPWA
jgi:type VI secretion system protein ImpC